MLTRLMQRKATAYVQLFVCLGALLFGGYYGVRYNRDLQQMRFERAELCASYTTDFRLINVKGTPRCVRKQVAEDWENSNIAVQVCVLIFIIFLLTPAVMRGDFVRKISED